jgi:hypothetical protein
MKPGHSAIYVVAEHGDAIHAKAVRAGAEIITAELRDTHFGSHTFSLRDTEGNTWTIGTYRGAPLRSPPSRGQQSRDRLGYRPSFRAVDQPSPNKSDPATTMARGRPAGRALSQTRLGVQQLSLGSEIRAMSSMVVTT